MVKSIFKGVGKVAGGFIGGPIGAKVGGKLGGLAGSAVKGGKKKGQPQQQQESSPDFIDFFEGSSGLMAPTTSISGAESATSAASVQARGDVAVAPTGNAGMDLLAKWDAILTLDEDDR
jgi:hypothetical protein